MKKYLSLVLACLMVLSSMAYAAPVTVGTVETAQEMTLDVSDELFAELSDETQEDEAVTTDVATQQLVISYGFDKHTADTAFSTVTLSKETADVYNIPAQFPEKIAFTLGIKSATGAYKATEEGGTDLYLQITPSATSSRWYVEGTEELPNGTYRITADFMIKEDASLDQSKNNFNVNLYETTNYPVVGKGHKIYTQNFTTTDHTYTYEKGVTNKDPNKTTAKGFQAYQSQGTGVWGVDNIKLYYTPSSYTVSFSGIGELPESVAVAQNGNFVPSEYIPKILPDAADKFLGWSLTENGEVLTDPIQITADTTLYAVYSKKEIETTSANYGKLAYFIDFDVNGVVIEKEKDGNGIDINKFTTYVAPSIEGMPAVVELETYYGKPYTKDGSLVWNEEHENNFPRIWFAAYEKDAETVASFPKGRYRIEFQAKKSEMSGTDVKVPISGIAAAPNWNTDALASWTIGSGSLTTEYTNYASTFSYYGDKLTNGSGTGEKVTKYKKEGETETTDASQGFSRFGLYTGYSNTKDYTRYIKYIKVWYIPYINLTLDANGKDVKVTNPGEVRGDITLADYTLEDCGTSRFVGWSLTKDGELITSTSLVLTEDTTLYAVWDDNFYAPEDEALNAGKILAHLHFNNMKKVTNATSQINNYGTIYDNWKAENSYTYPQIILGSEDTSYPANIWLAGKGIDAPKYSTEHADGELVIKNESGTAKKTYWPKLAIHNYEKGKFADGIYTFAAEVYVEPSDNLQSVTYAAYAKDHSIETAGPGIEIPAGERVYVRDAVVVYNGVAYKYDTMKPYSNKLSKELPVVGVGLNFTLNLKENAKAAPSIYADNFRIYYKPYDSAPAAYKENSIRVDGQTGIRFKASVSNLERNNENVTEYGYIVTRKDLLGSTDINSFTHETAVKMVSGKNYSSAEKIDLIYAEDSYRTFFTAVVYNIPAASYDSDLVVRPYVLVDGKYVYGDAMVNNIKAVAQKLKDDAEKYELYKDAIDKILAGQEL